MSLGLVLQLLFVSCKPRIPPNPSSSTLPRSMLFGCSFSVPLLIVLGGGHAKMLTFSSSGSSFCSNSQQLWSFGGSPTSLQTDMHWQATALFGLVFVIPSCNHGCCPSVLHRNSVVPPLRGHLEFRRFPVIFFVRKSNHMRHITLLRGIYRSQLLLMLTGGDSGIGTCRIRI